MKSLKALLVEDSKDDAALLLRHLFNEGYDVQSEIVQTAADLKAALGESKWDIILSDYVMPGFTGLDALSVLKKSGQDIPIIIISGTIGEDTAVEAMVSGVNDYLMKGNLRRLVPAIERELENATRRRAQKQVEESLRRSEENLANAQRIVHIGSWETDLVTNQLYWSDEVYRIFGVSKDDFGATLESFFSFIHPEDRQLVQDAADAAVSQNAPYNIEHRIITQTGVERIVREIGEVTFDEAGKPVRMIGTVQDITERKLMENDLSASKALLINFVTHTPAAVAMLDTEMRYLQVSQQWLTDYNLADQDIIGKTHYEVFPDVPERWKEIHQRCLAGAIEKCAEDPFPRADGTLDWLQWETRPWHKGDSEIGGILFFTQVITKRKQAEEDLKKSVKRERAMIDNALDVICTIDAEGKFVSVSPASLKVWGYQPEELVGQPYFELVAPEDVAKTNKEALDIMSGVEARDFENRYRHKNGLILHIRWTALWSETDQLMFCIAHDITGRKRAEENLRESEERYRSIVETTREWIWAFDFQGNCTYSNPAIETILGYTPEKLLGKSFLPFVYVEDREKIEQLLPTLIAEKRGWSNLSCRWYHNDGSVRDLESNAVPIFNSEGEVIGFRGADRDITERKRAEEEKIMLAAQIEQQHERLKNIVANVPGVVWEAWGKPDAATQRIDFVSDYVETMLGYTVEEWLTTPNFWLSIVHPEDKKEIAREATERFLNGGGYSRQFPFRWVAKNGRSVWVESQATVIRDEAGQPIGLRGFNIDITERKRLESERVKLVAELDFEKARLQHIFDNSPSFIVALRGPDFVFERANPAYYKLVGQRNLIGIPVREALPELVDQGFIKFLDQVYSTGEPYIGIESAVKLQLSDGKAEELIYLNFINMPIREADGTISGILSYGVDVTEQVLSRIKIEESEERYRFLFDNNPLPMWVFNLETLGFLSVNAAAVEHYGYSEEEFLTMTLRDLRPPEDIPAFLKNVKRDVPGIRKVGGVRHRKKDGTIIYADITSNQLIFEGKKAKLALANDVTERRKAEESVRFQAHLLNTVEQSVIATDLNGIVAYWNQFAEKLYGWTIAEALGRNVKELTTPEINLEQANQILARLSTGKSWSGEFVVRNKAGVHFPAHVSNSPVHDGTGKLIGIVGVSVDISERKRSEQQIIESEEKYRSIVETANEGILLNDIDGRVVFVNRQMPEMLGYTADEMLGRTIFDFIFEEDLAVTKQKIERRKQGKAETSEIRLRRKDGSEIIYLQKSSPTRNEAGEITGLLSMNTDITERKKVERELQNAEAKYRNLVQSSPAIVYLAEPLPPFSPIYVSPNVEVFGYTTEEWFNRLDMWVNIIHEDDRGAVLRATEDAIALNIETDLEYRIVRRDDTIIWVHDKGRFVLDEQGNKTGWQGVMVDITKTKALEDQLRQAQKLESVGLLAGGIAHDFNNMLTAINGYSELTLRKLEADSPLRWNIEEIKKAGERSALLTHQLLAFSRQQVLQPVVLDLNEVITDTIKLLQRVIGEDVKLVTKFNPKTGLVNVDPGQLSQIIMNLTVNARDAMPHGGKLTIETANVFLEPEDVRQKVGILPGAYVMMAVCDTGQGMDDKIQPQIFEPFFTTKELGKGTGLGLATVYGITKQSGGNIEFDSKVGVGTTFRIYLPRVAEQPAAVEVTDTSAEFLTGTETILLVEDEELVRNLSREMLETCGYKIIEARDGFEALQIFDAGDCKPDLLITDVVMPQMGGRELAGKLMKKLPDIKILFTSGYTDDAIIRHGITETNTDFIQKPFTFDALNRKVRKILDAEGLN